MRGGCQSYAGAHFATFPKKLVEPCVLAGTSAGGCCSRCGAPLERVLGDAKEVAGRASGNIERKLGDESAGESRLNTHLGYAVPWSPSVRPTIGWKPTCECGAGVRPCTVFDPFVGSGTTVVVARALGRRGIGCDLSADYLTLAKKRLIDERPIANRLAQLSIDGT